ncbi:MAG: sigma-70 family RNA polymerase sigma factor [Verrucomicrobia bacterium]|nr:sigma-70 family RNA polymerase sigma factor [Verrucomicrobiota bacterium]
MTDAQLLREYATAGSEEAFAQLVSRYAGLVHAAAVRQTGKPDWAQDVTQAVFVLLARKAGALSPDIVVAGWLMRATRFAASDLLRSERRRLARETAAFHMNDPSESGALSSSESGRLWDRIAPVLDACLARLREGDRDALLLRYFQNRSLAEVGASLGVAEDAARKRVTRALDRLRSELARQGAVASAAALPELLLREAAPAVPGPMVGSTVSAALASPGSHAARVLGLSESLARNMTWTGLKVWFAAAGAAMLVLGAGWWAFPSNPAAPRSAEVLADGDYRVAGFPDPRVVHQFIRDLQRELRAGDRTGVARRIRYPLEVHGREMDGAVGGEAAVLAAFERLFTESVAGEILKCPAQRLHCTADGVMIGGGSIWIAPAPGSGHPQIALVNLP